MRVLTSGAMKESEGWRYLKKGAPHLPGVSSLGRLYKASKPGGVQLEPGSLGLAMVRAVFPFYGNLHPNPKPFSPALVYRVAKSQDFISRRLIFGISQSWRLRGQVMI